MNSVNEYLMHHGIMGQKWGHQNGPPYPLNPANRSASEKRKNGDKYTKSAKEVYGGSKTFVAGGGGASFDDEEKWKEKLRQILLNQLNKTDGYKFISKEDFSHFLESSGIDVNKISSKNISSMYDTAIKLNKSIIKTYDKKGKLNKSSAIRADEEKHALINKINKSKDEEVVTIIKTPSGKDFKITAEDYKKQYGLNKFSKERKAKIDKQKKKEDMELRNKKYMEDLGEKMKKTTEELEEKNKKMKRFIKHSELYHHGIMGMKWGRQNGPPYPLDRAVSKAVKAQAKADRYQKRADLKAEKAELKQQRKINRAERFYYSVPGQIYFNGLKRSKWDTKQMSYEEIKKRNQSPERSLSDYSDDEIRSAINRIKLENDYFRVVNERNNIRSSNESNNSNNSSNNSNNSNNSSNNRRILVPTDIPEIARGREYVNNLNKDVGEYVKVGMDVVKLINNIYDTKNKFSGKSTNTNSITIKKLKQH